MESSTSVPFITPLIKFLWKKLFFALLSEYIIHMCMEWICMWYLASRICSLTTTELRRYQLRKYYLNNNTSTTASLVKRKTYLFPIHHPSPYFLDVPLNYTTPYYLKCSHISVAWYHVFVFHIIICSQPRRAKSRS